MFKKPWDNNIIRRFLRGIWRHTLREDGANTSRLQPPKETGGYPRGVMVKAMDCGIVAREFVLQSRYYVHFRANTLGKGMNLLILPAMG